MPRCQRVPLRTGQMEGYVVIEERAASIRECPHCGHKAIKWGGKNGVPRFNPSPSLAASLNAVTPSTP